MNLLNKLTIKNLKLNKKRTIVTVIGIMLSVALITAVASLYTSAVSSFTEYIKKRNGNFHVVYYNVPYSEVDTIKNHRGIESMAYVQNLGYAKLKDSNNNYKPYAYVKSFDEYSLKNLSIRLVSGRLPENENEILIPTHLKTNGRIQLSIGDEIKLDIGKRISGIDNIELDQSNPYQENEKIENTVSKTYKIVGIIERPAYNIEDYSSAGYTFITYMNEINKDYPVDLYTLYSDKGLKDYIKVTASILNVDYKIYKEYINGNMTTEEVLENESELKKAKYDIEINDSLIVLETNPISDSTLGGLSAVAIIVCIIIIFTSVFCIKNSFDISITEKIKQYAMLRSIGATKKQIKKNVFYEATILGIIGIPLGILLGFFASIILLFISNNLLDGMTANKLNLHYTFSFLSIFISIILGIITIYLSALRSATKASKVSLIESIRNSSNIKVKSKKLKSKKIINKLFGIGGDISYKNMKRNSSKYRTTIISIAVSSFVFISLSSFMTIVNEAVKKEYNSTDYNIGLYVYNENKITDELYDKIIETTRLDNIDKCAIIRNLNLNVHNIKYTKDMMDSLKKSGLSDDDIEHESNLALISIGDDAYKDYLSKLNLKYEDAKDKVILINRVNREYFDLEKQKSIQLFFDALDYKKNDKISGIVEGNKKIELEIISVTDEKYFSLNNDLYNPTLIISDELFDKIKPKENTHYINVYYKSSNAYKLQDDIDIVLKDESYTLNNVDEQVKLMNNFYTLIAIFLYGFIIVISLIGITNIFNTITTNMELRRQEFAMLKSVGMTTYEFNRMIRLESIFIGVKSLIFSIPIGVLISYIIYIKLGKEIGLIYSIPIVSILLSILVVFLLITIIMKYSLSKINKQNTIETIRNENI